MGVGRTAAVSAEPGHSLERLYREDGARLWRALLAFSGDREVASDAVAEAFAQALGRGDAIRQPDRWVWRAAFRIAAGELEAGGGRWGRIRPMRCRSRLETSSEHSPSCRRSSEPRRSFTTTWGIPRGRSRRSFLQVLRPFACI